MIVDLISDLHGFYPKLEGGDLLIIAGDLTRSDRISQYAEFIKWISQQDYRKKIVIAGNHDNILQDEEKRLKLWGYRDLGNCEYLEDSGTVFEGWKIWGSPWTRKFEGGNRHCMAFTCDTEEELKKKWVLMPDDTDILMTHSPPYGIMDGVDILNDGTDFHVGSKSLYDKVCQVTPKIHIWGHIHEGHGDCLLKHQGPNTICVNASFVNECYKAVNKPIRVIL